MNKQEFVDLMLGEGCKVVPGKMTTVITPRGQAIKIREMQDDICVNVNQNLMYFDNAYVGGGQKGKAELVLLSKNRGRTGRLRLREG